MQRWMRQMMRRASSNSKSVSETQSSVAPANSKSGSDAAVTKVASDNAALLSEKNKSADVLNGLNYGVQRLNDSATVLNSVRSSLLEIRGLAQSASTDGVDRTLVQSRINELLSQINGTVTAARSSGNEALDSGGEGLRIRTGINGNRSFSVNVAKEYTVGTNSSSISVSGERDLTRLFGNVSEDGGKAIPIGTDGSMVVIGSTLGAFPGQTSSVGWDGFVARYGPSGELQSARQFEDRFVSNGAVAADGSVFIVGSTTTSIDGQAYVGGDRDSFISKLNADGTTAWTRIVAGTGGDFARSVAVAGDGSVYMVGVAAGDYTTHFDGLTNPGGAFIVKFNSSGTKQWSKRVGVNLADEGSDVAVGADGSVYLAGEAWRSKIINSQTKNVKEAFVSKFAPDGTNVWSQFLETPEGQSSIAGSVTVGSDGAVYVGGATWGNLEGQTLSGTVGVNNDAFVSKISASGTKEWTRLTGNSGNDSLAGITAGKDGYIYGSGITRAALDGQASLGNEDVFLVKYDTGGNKIFTKLVGVQGSGSNDIPRPWGLTTASDGSIIMSGHTHGNLDGQINTIGKSGFYTRFNAQSTVTGTAKTMRLQYGPVDVSSSQAATAAVTSVDELIKDIDGRMKKNSSSLRRAQATRSYFSSMVTIYEKGIRARTG